MVCDTERKARLLFSVALEIPRCLRLPRDDSLAYEVFVGRLEPLLFYWLVRVPHRDVEDLPVPHRYTDERPLLLNKQGRTVAFLHRDFVAGGAHILELGILAFLIFSFFHGAEVDGILHGGSLVRHAHAAQVVGVAVLPMRRYLARGISIADGHLAVVQSAQGIVFVFEGAEVVAHVYELVAFPHLFGQLTPGGIA